MGEVVATFAHVVYIALAVAIVVAVVVADHFLPDSGDEELRRFYRGAYKRRRKRGEID